MTLSAEHAGALPDDEVLRTVAIGPRVAGPRDAVRALAVYAREEAAARPGPLDRALWGVAQVVRAVRLVATDRALRRAALVPTALTTLACVGLAALATWDSISDGELADERAATFHAFVVAFVAIASMPPTLLQRMWMRVAGESRRALGLPGAEDPFAGEPFVRMLWREGRKVVRQAVLVSAGLFPFLVVVRLLPFGQEEAAGVAAVWTFYWIVADALELPIEAVPGPPPSAPEPWFARLLRRAPTPLLWPLRISGRLAGRLATPWREECHFTERHPWETVGFAVAAGVLLAIPGLGLFFRAVAITAATALHGGLDETR